MVPEGIFGPSVEVIEPDKKVTDLLDVLRRHLGMDVTLLGMWQDDLLVVQVISGDGASFGLAPGVTVHRKVKNQRILLTPGVPLVSPDTRRDSRTRDQPIVKHLDVGAYVSANAVDSAGDPYGLLSCLSHQPRPGLRQRDQRFVHTMAEFLSDSLLDVRHMWEARCQVWRAVCDLVDRGGPRVVFQPIVHMTSGAVAGVEALSRFPDLGDTRVRRPSDWFTDADAVGLGTSLEMAAIHQAIDVLPDLPPGMKLAVNASPATVCTDLPAAVRRLPDPTRLVVEITEHENWIDNPDIFRAIDQLRRSDVRIAIDDAGTGYSGLVQLLQIRPDIVKLDRLLTHGLDHSPARQVIANGLVRLADVIGGTVIAEGIETSAECEAAMAIGIPYGQGFLLGGPAASPPAARDQAVAHSR